MIPFGFNVTEFGAKGDGITDDTKAIQAAIDYAVKRGGGRILFHYTPKGYRIASPAIEEYEGRPVRSQLVIPSGSANLYLEGEMPCRVLNSYMVRPSDVSEAFKPTRFGAPPIDNTVLFSDWDAPEVHDPTERPYSVLSSPEGNSCAGRFGLRQFSMANLEVRVPMRRDKMYPTQSAVNLQNVSRIHICDCHFCLNEQVGDAFSDKELQPNPCHTVGLMTSGDQNDDNVLRNVAVQGFRYGFVLGEHVVADYLYVHNCEEAIVFHDSSHLSVIGHVVAQHNRKILSATRDELFGHRKGACNVIVGSVNFESGVGLKPAVSRLEYGVYDPEHRLRGELTWHEPWGKQEFPVVCSKRFHTTKF